MDRTLSEYAAKQFSSDEVRKKLAEAISSKELVDEFADSYAMHQDHIQRALLGPHDGEEWEEWNFLLEEKHPGDGVVLVESGRVLWNDMDVELSDSEIDARLVAVVVHVLMWGFDDSWYDLYSILDSSVDEDPRKYGLAKDILVDGRFLGSVRAFLSSLSSRREASIIEELNPVVREWAIRGEEAAYPATRLWCGLLGDHAEAKYWAYRMGDRPTPF